jgi:LemA protein
MDLLAWVVTALIVVLMAGLIALYNRLVRLRNGSEEGWAQIDVQLNRRYDLVPNLVATVTGYAAHERDTLEAVTRARSKAVDASGVEDQARAENALTVALGRLFALAEAYPPLQADDTFLALQEELSETEGRIGFARQYYNERVLGYDNALATFPSNLIGGAFGFRPKPFFETEPEVRGPAVLDSPSGR